ncbi:hypothetical protein [Anaerofustis stercorihominis]|uniref:Uncharacterized protein n=1 Tax=Anaerofustis stercorihominis TaxID=214853 RepID=A0A3E3E2J1_9FIRM|nr:hypothetical protein [Anaerofustis stercorihominis]RGD75781.1 hypothetical protein DW687_00215 [Anaerofustis stercorihominis]
MSNSDFTDIIQFRKEEKLSKEDKDLFISYINENNNDICSDKENNPIHTTQLYRTIDGNGCKKERERI